MFPQKHQHPCLSQQGQPGSDSPTPSRCSHTACLAPAQGFNMPPTPAAPPGSVPGHRSSQYPDGPSQASGMRVRFSLALRTPSVATLLRRQPRPWSCWERLSRVPRTESLEDTVQWGDPPCLPQPSLAKELGGADRAGSMCDKHPSWGEASVSGPELEQSQGATPFVSKWSAKGCLHLPVPTGDQEEQEGHPQRSWVLGDR